MALVLSVLTPDWLLQVSDAPQARPRTLKLQRHGAPGLLSLLGEGPILDALVPEIDKRNAADPSELSTWLATELGARCGAEEPTTALLAGWGVSPEGHRASWRWRVSNFEVDGDAGPFAVEGSWIVPSYAQPGGLGKARARTSFSVQVSSTVPLPEAITRSLDKLPRDLRRNVSPTELAIRLAGWVQQTHDSTPALIALLRPDGSFEGGLLDDSGLSPLTAPPGDGVSPLRPAPSSG